MFVEKHYGNGVRHGSVSTVSFLKIRNGLGARKGENRLMDPNRNVAKSGVNLDYEMKRRRGRHSWGSRYDSFFIGFVAVRHPSQANTRFWNITDVIDALDTLKVHPGFPRSQSQRAIC